MPLTDPAIRNTKPRERPYKLGDAGGLYLLVTPSGGKGWRLKYRFQGREKLLSLGVYPQVSLQQARARRDDSRKLLAQGIDPSQARKAAKAARDGKDTLQAVAAEWFGQQRWAPEHAAKVLRCLERDVFPWLGARPIGAITTPELRACLRRIADRGAVETARRVLQNLSRILRYAISNDQAEHDHAADLRGAFTPVKGRHYSAITDRNACNAYCPPVGPGGRYPA